MPESRRRRGEALAVRCAWCGRYRLADRWVDDALAAGARTSHGVCPDCFRRLLLSADGGGHAHG